MRVKMFSVQEALFAWMDSVLMRAHRLIVVTMDDVKAAYVFVMRVFKVTAASGRKIHVCMSSAMGIRCVTMGNVSMPLIHA